MVRSWALIFLLISSSGALAAMNIYDFNDAQKAARFHRLINMLRCPKCQNNNLADSNAPLATDIKRYIYRSMQSGHSDAQITDFLISRYGEFIVYQPRSWWVRYLAFVIGALTFLMVLVNLSKKRKAYVSNQAPESASDKRL